MVVIQYVNVVNLSKNWFIYFIRDWTGAWKSHIKECTLSNLNKKYFYETFLYFLRKITHQKCLYFSYFCLVYCSYFFNIAAHHLISGFYGCHQPTIIVILPPNESSYQNCPELINNFNDSHIL